MPAIPWHAEFDQPSRACQAEAIERLVEILAAGMTRAGVRLVALRSRAIFEAEFNDLCDGHGSKAQPCRTKRWPWPPERSKHSREKRGQAPFAGTARRVLRTNGACPLFLRAR